MIYPIIRFFIVSRPIIKICNLVLFKISRPKKQILNYSDFYFPQQKFLPEESKLFDRGKVNIQILMPDKKVEMTLKSISLICIKFRISWYFTPNISYIFLVISISSITCSNSKSSCNYF